MPGWKLVCVYIHEGVALTRKHHNMVGSSSYLSQPKVIC